MYQRRIGEMSRTISESGTPWAAIDAEAALHQVADERQLLHPVSHGSEHCSHAAEFRHVREDPRPQRRAVGLMVVGEELVLELGHVHVGRTLTLTGFAFEAEIEDLVNAVIGQGVGCAGE